MRDAIGVLKWRPAEFWSTTLTEYMLAIEGYNDAEGGGERNDGPSDDDMTALLARYG